MEKLANNASTTLAGGGVNNSADCQPKLCSCGEPMRSYIAHGCCEDCYWSGRKAEALVGNASMTLRAQPRNMLEPASGEERIARILRATDQLDNEE